MEHVILVDKDDNAVGIMEKMEAHQKGLLHRAFSILIFNAKGEMLLQKRSKKKYHSGGLWTNACCSHPYPAEAMEDAVHRKLIQEMGIDVTPRFAYTFIYKTNLDKNLIEHELDHVFIGNFNGTPTINKDEVEDWKFIDLKSLRNDIAQNPEDYTYWFKLILEHSKLNVLLT